MTIAPDTIIALDLEMNQPLAGSGLTNTPIIQVGAVAGNYKTGQILSEFCEFVNPEETLNPEIIQLTGITQENVDAAADLPAVYRQMCHWLGPFRGRRLLNPLTWGSGDSQLLMEQLEDKAVLWPFGRRWYDAKTVFQTWRIANDEPLQGGLAKSMTKLGINFAGAKHNALDDARNTFRIYCALMDKLKEKP